MIKFDPISRRQFLVASGGFALAIPLLPSLLHRSVAQAQVPPSLLCLRTGHGWANRLYPASMSGGLVPAGATQLQISPASGNQPAHVIRSIPLSNLMSGNQFSPILGAGFTPFLSQMNVLRGIDLGFYTGHGRFDLGNLRNTDSPSTSEIPQIPSVDYFLSRLPGAYPAPVAIPLVIITREQGVSYGDPASGPNWLPSTADSTLSLFNSIFNVSQGGTPPNTLVVDKAYEAYESLVNGAWGPASRLSTEDRNVITSHMDRLRDLQTSLNSNLNCSAGSPQNLSIYYSGFTAQQAFWRPVAQVLAAAMACGATRFASLTPGQEFDASVLGTAIGDPHQEIFHEQLGSAVAGPIREYYYQRQFADFVLPFLQEMAAYQLTNGKSLLENSLVVYQAESSPYATHTQFDLTTITFGTAGGRFNTGLMIDYRNFQNQSVRIWGEPGYPGLLLHQFLGTIAQAFGATPAQYERPNAYGYGEMPALVGTDPSYYVTTSGHIPYLRPFASQPLPVLWKT